MRESGLHRAISRLTPFSYLGLVILCFEAWNGNHHLAVQQIQLGFKLIRAWQDEHAGTRPGVYGSSSLSGSQVMEDDLVKTFSRLDVQVL
jgi:hypothetical protein